MKIRNDFVTNSSSSSYIISTKEEVPEKYKSYVEEVTSQNLTDVVKSIYNRYDEPLSYDITDEEIQKIGNFTDDQMELIRFISSNTIEEYLSIKSDVESAEDPVYHIFEDRDVLYYQYELKDFIDRAKIINYETDL